MEARPATKAPKARARAAQNHLINCGVKDLAVRATFKRGAPLLKVARTAKSLTPQFMRWFCAALALAFGALVAGLASIVLGYRQVIRNYIQNK